MDAERKLRLMAKPELDEWMEELATFVESDPGEVLLGKLLRQKEAAEKAQLLADITTEEGRLKAIRHSGVAIGLQKAIETLMESVNDREHKRKRHDEAEWEPAGRGL